MDERSSLLAAIARQRWTSKIQTGEDLTLWCKDGKCGKKTWRTTRYAKLVGEVGRASVEELSGISVIRTQIQGNTQKKRSLVRKTKKFGQRLKSPESRVLI